MGILKNDVGRPSNKTIIIRTILKGICLIIILALVAVGAYYLGNSNGESKSSNKNKTTTKQSVNKAETFDKNQVTTKSDSENDYLDLYVYGNKINIDYITDVVKVDTLQDIAIIELGRIESNDLLIVNTNGDVLFLDEYEGGWLCNEGYQDECYGYKINGNKIKFMLADLGQEIEYAVCNVNKNKQVLAEYELTYKDGKLLKEKKSSLTGSEYAKKYNINCSE